MGRGAARREKSLCDKTGISSKESALKHLKAGLKRGLICKRWQHGWPRHIWSKTHDDIVLEAKCGNNAGVYHGYPLVSNDPIAMQVLKR